MTAALDTSPGLREQRIWELLGEVPDPEIPVLSIVDLGIVRHVRCDAAGRDRTGGRGSAIGWRYAGMEKMAWRDDVRLVHRQRAGSLRRIAQ